MVAASNLGKTIAQIREFTRSKFWLEPILHYQAHSHYNKYPAGFHVHIGSPLPIVTRVSDWYIDFLRSYALVLDYFLGIPAMLFESSSKRRLSTRYGKPGGFRLKRRTIEYRSLGADLLRCRTAVEGIFCITKLVSSDLFNFVDARTDGFRKATKKSMSSDILGRYKIPDKRVIRTTLEHPDKDVAKDYIDGISRRLEWFETYNGHVKAARRFLLKAAKGGEGSPSFIENWEKAQHEQEFGSVEVHQ